MPTTNRLAAILLAGAAILPAAAVAQTADTEPDGDDREIVVTALLESQPLATTGAPVSVIDGRDVRDWTITTAERAADFSTALTVLPNATATIIFLRGVGNFTLIPSTDPAVGWNYDGVFIARSNATQG